MTSKPEPKNAPEVKVVTRAEMNELLDRVTRVERIMDVIKTAMPSYKFPD